MSSVMQALSYSPELEETIINDIDGQAEKNVTHQVIQCFNDAGLAISVKHIFYNTPNAYYRVLCFIKKSKETVIINTRQDNGPAGVVNGMNIQLRIENKSTFSKLDSFTGNICNQILNSNDCSYCSDKCEGKRYTFTYHGNEYVKCQFLCSNFRFMKINESDITSLMDIINGEITYKQYRTK